MSKNQRIRLESSLESSRSLQISLDAIRSGNAGLTEKRMKMLDRVPNIGEYASFQHNTLEIKDLAFLSAFTNHEFALLRGKKNDILFHGSERECSFSEELEELLISKKMRLIAHSHPDYGMITPSKADRLFLKKINQEESSIISWTTGRQQTFSSDDLF